MKYLINLILLFLLIPTVNAWKWTTHENIIEYVYYNLPLEKQQELNLTKLKEGSIIPDRDFRDTRKHSLPKSLEEAEKWLNNDSDLSLNIGIASHYISDSFVAPHNIAGEDYDDHAKYEGQVKYYYPNSDCKDYGYRLEDLKIASKNSKNWNLWLKTKNKSVPEKEVEESTKFLFSIILNKLNTTCIEKTKIEEIPYFNRKKLIISSLILLIGLYLIKKF
ncbi:zinc dependent phospholipase C family protein [Candidatus Woesearchaeota archaeon]|nr:zinc dependent phospholipase C family protein [Candidatus Woesearchaeota archaeon]